MKEMIKENIGLFFYWMNERHMIYLNKEYGKPWPWTKDPILQKYKFTNVYRNYDRVTKELHNLIILPEYGKSKETLSMLLFRIALFRMFNLASTYIRLEEQNLANKWSENRAKNTLKKAAKRGSKIFTGAYIITNNGSKRPKIDLVCESVTKIWKDREKLLKEISENSSLMEACRTMQRYPLIGSFIAYELVTDFRWTPILSHADDIMTWANPGPGAKRGINRLYGDPLSKPIPERLCVKDMQYLLNLSQKRGRLKKHMEPLEMRDIEHSLCEFDKYMRVRNGEGKPRSIYKPKMS